MGYFDLEEVEGSDAASDCAYVALTSMAKALKKQLKETGNTYNTCGTINVALFFEQFLLPISKKLWNCEELFELAKETKKRLDAKIKDCENLTCDNNEDKLYHIKSYKRMLDSLNKYIKIIKKEQP